MKRKLACIEIEEVCTAEAAAVQAALAMQPYAPAATAPPTSALWDAIYTQVAQDAQGRYVTPEPPP